MAETTNFNQDVVIRGAMKPGYEKVLTPEAVAFAVELERTVRSGTGFWPAGPGSSASSIPGGSPIFCPTPRRSAKATGGLRQSRATSRTAASRSPAQPTARW